MSDATPMRLLVTGSRGWTDHALIADALVRTVIWFAGRHEPNQHVPPGEWVTLVHGNAKGADRMCKAFAETVGWHTEEHLPQWSNPDGTKNYTAGFERNEHMVRAGVDVCVAFAGYCSKYGHREEPLHVSHGCEHCAAYAHAMGVPVFSVYPDGRYSKGVPTVG